MARAGLRVLVLEARGIVGGAAVTEELGGARVPTLAHTVGRLRAVRRPRARPREARPRARRARGAGLRAPGRRPRGDAVRGPRAGAWTRCAPFSEDDATAFVEYDRRVRSLSRFLADLGDEAPPDIKGPGFGDALLGLRLGPRVPRPGQARRPHDPARPRDGGRRLRGRVVRDRADPRDDRLARRPVHGDGPLVRGLDVRAARRRRRQRRRGRRRDRVREGRARPPCPRRWPPPRVPPAPRSAPARGSSP